MSNKTYKWKRFWCPNDNNYFVNENGFLEDPESVIGKFQNPNTVLFEQIMNVNCLILLGEPGIGKTYCIKEEIKKHYDGMKTLFVDLRQVSVRSDFKRDLFDNKKFSDWNDNYNYDLHIFIDGFDECPLNTEDILLELTKGFSKNQSNRLFLCFISRKSLLKDIGKIKDFNRDLWSETQKEGKIFELTPLRLKDVELALSEESLDFNDFYNKVIQNGIEALASRPVTLMFLIDIFRNHKNVFPKNQLDLYKKGCMELCREKEYEKTGLESNEKLALAGRIAVSTIFSNLSIITDDEYSTCLKEKLIITDLLINGCLTEKIFNANVNIKESYLKKTLETALFNRIEKNQWIWAHRSYAEYLAALYICEHNMDTSQIKKLIFIETEYGKQIVPQLEETAVWIAIMKPDIFDEIAQINPLILLQATPVFINEESAYKLVNNLFKLLCDDNNIYHKIKVINKHHKLKNRELSNQVIRHLSPENNEYVRFFAIDLANKCNIYGVQNEILEIALAQKENHRLRIRALRYLKQIADSTTRIKLMPLLNKLLNLNEEDEDIKHEIRGHTLLNLWPEHIKTKDLFPMLPPLKLPKMIDSYLQLMEYELPKFLTSEKITDDDIIAALKWLFEQEFDYSLLDEYYEINDAIILSSLKHLDSQDVINLLAAIIAQRLNKSLDTIKEHEYKLKVRDHLNGHDNERRKILFSNITQTNFQINYWAIINSDIPLVKHQDKQWILDRLFESNSEEKQKVWADFLFSVQKFYWEPQDANILYNACQQNAILKEVFRNYFQPIALDSVEANRSRNIYFNDKVFLKKSLEKKYNIPSYEEMIIIPLQEVESGNLGVWQIIVNNLITRNRHASGTLRNTDITTFSDWKEADFAVKERVKQACLKFINEFLPDNEAWINDWYLHNRCSIIPIDYYISLVFLLKSSPELIGSLSKEIWEKWAPTIVFFPLCRVVDDIKHYKELLSLAYKNAPKTYKSAFFKAIDMEVNKNEKLYVLNYFEDFWDEHLAIKLIEKVKDSNIKLISFEDILKHLFKMKYREAKEIAESFLTTPIQEDEMKRQKAIICAFSLINYTNDAGWKILWPIFQSDDAFGIDVCYRIAEGQKSRRYENLYEIYDKFNEDELADFYVWLEKNFPPNEDPKHKPREGYRVTPRHRIIDMRDKIIDILKNKGTKESIDNLYKISKNCPRLQKCIKRVLEIAISNYHRFLWEDKYKQNPIELIELIHNNEKRSVSNDDDLLNVLIESLERFQEKLKGEGFVAQFLWNYRKDGNKKIDFSPKDENELSDLLKYHFDCDLKKTGIIVNREVEIRPKQKTDIHIDVINPNTKEKVTVIIEVKCCWNDSLFTSMETQLIEKYLKNNCRCGIYLVGWYYCENWSEDDNRKDKSKDKKRNNIEDVKSNLEKQANDLSNKYKGIKVYPFILDITYRN